MKASKARILSLALAACLVLGMVLYLPEPVTVSADLPPYGDDVEGKPWDGIDFAAMDGSGIYYGWYRHQLDPDPTNESNPTPVLWRVMGEENNSGNLTLFSEYVITLYNFNESSSGDNAQNYAESDVNVWLNGMFFNDLFQQAETNWIVPVDIVTGMYNVTNGEQYTGLWPKTAKDQYLYLPHGGIDNQKVYWEAGNTRDSKYEVTSRIPQFKGGYNEINYWLRSPYSGDTSCALSVVHIDEVQWAYVTYNRGVRPAFQLNPSKILHTEKITADDNDYSASAGNGDNYKLTIINDAIKLDNLQYNSSAIPQNGIVVKQNAIINLTAQGDGTKLAYKIVSGTSSRQIDSYGYEDSNTELSIETRSLSPGDYTVYVWAQKDNDKNSHEGSEPVWFKLNIDGTPPKVESVTPSGTGISLGTSSLSITFDKDMNTTVAGTVNITDGADVENGVWDNRTITYDLSGLDYSTTYNISISGFQDTSGNRMLLDNYHSFTTVDAPPPGQHTVTVAASPPQGGNPKASPANAASDEQITLTANPNTDWRFDGWSSISLGVSFGDAAAQTTTFSMPDNDVDVTASYTYIGDEGNTYTVTYAANGATSGSVPVDGRDYNPGDTVTVQGNTGNLARTGYQFNGWRNSQDNGTYSGREQFAIQSNVTLTAQWLEDGGGSTSGNSSRSSRGSSGSTYTAPAKTQLPATAFSWDGRTLTIDHDNISPLGLLNVRWDGVETMAFSKYQGSVVIRFDQDFIDSQTNGNHTVRVEFLQHYGETTVTVGETSATDDLWDNATDNPNTGGYPDGAVETNANPNTGDGRTIWAALLLGSLSGLSLILCWRQEAGKR